MQVKNCWELKLPFEFDYLGVHYVIPYGAVRDVPDGAVDPNGVKGYLLCRPSPIRSYIPNIYEVNLNTIPKKYQLTPEQEIKAKEVLEKSMAETIRITEANKKERETSNEQDNQENSNEENNSSKEIRSLEGTKLPISSSQENNPEAQRTISEVNSVKKVKPLAGKKIADHIRKRGIKSRIEKKTLPHSKDSSSNNP